MHRSWSSFTGRFLEVTTLIPDLREYKVKNKIEGTNNIEHDAGEKS